MKWLLLVLLFQLDASGQPGPATVAQQVFPDEASCMTAGAKAKGIIPSEIRMIATCVPESAFNLPKAPASPPAPAPKAPAGK